MEINGFSETLLSLYDLCDDNLPEDHKTSCLLSIGLKTLHVTVLKTLHVMVLKILNVDILCAL